MTKRLIALVMPCTRWTTQSAAAIPSTITQARATLSGAGDQDQVEVLQIRVRGACDYQVA